MDDLQEEHEVNKYLLQQEKELRDRMEGMLRKQERYSSQPTIKQNRATFREDFDLRLGPGGPKEVRKNITNLDQISQKEEELMAQLNELRNMKKMLKPQ